jgi:hypothetical protein
MKTPVMSRDSSRGRRSCGSARSVRRREFTGALAEAMGRLAPDLDVLLVEEDIPLYPGKRVDVRTGSGGSALGYRRPEARPSPLLLTVED